MNATYWRSLSCALLAIGLLANAARGQVSVLHVFTGVPDGAIGNNSIGEEFGQIVPGTLIVSGDTIYGTTAGGGAGGAADSADGAGTLWEMGTDGSEYKLLRSFNYANGDAIGPYALILSGDTLYGTGTSGGGSPYGAVYSIRTDGTNYQNLQSFSYANLNGIIPSALALSGSTLYGATSFRPGSGGGTVYELGTDESGIQPILNSGDVGAVYQMVSSGSTLYGVNVDGPLFRINTDGTDFQTLPDFSSGFPNQENGEFVLSGSTLYGISYAVNYPVSVDPSNPLYFHGQYIAAVYKVNTDGTGFQVLQTIEGTGQADANGLIPGLA